MGNIPLQINKKTDLPTLTVRGNDWQAPSLSIAPPQPAAIPPPIPVNGSTSYYRPPQQPSWNTPAPVAERRQLPVGPFQFGSGIVNPGVNNSIARFGAGVLNDFLNSPWQTAKGMNRISQDRDIGGGFGDILKGVLDFSTIAPIGKGAQAALKGGKIIPRLAQSAIGGAKIGGGYGVGYGVADPLSQNANPLEVAKGGAIGGIAGVGAGAIAGPTAILAGEGTKQGVKLARYSKELSKGDERGAVGKLTLKEAKKTELPKAPIAEVDQKLQEAILGHTDSPEYKDRMLGNLAEKLSINKVARKLTQPVEGVVNKGIRASLESGSRLGRGVGRTAVGVSRQAGRTPEEIKRLAEYQGEKQLGDIYGKDIATTGDQAVKQGIRKEAVHEILDPELYAAKGKEITNHTEEEVAAAEKLRQVNQIIHEGNHSLGLLDDATYKKNKGQYIARNADDYFKDEAAARIAKDNKLDLKIFKGRKELDKIPDAVIKAMDEDPYFLTAMRAQQYQRNKSFVEYSNWLADHGSVSKTPKKGYIEVPDSPVYGALKGKHILKEQLEDLQGFIYETSNAQHGIALMNAYDRFAPRKARKSILTIYNPGVRIGNRTFNYLVSSLNGINPITFTKNYARGRKMIRTNSPEYIEATKSGIFGSSIIDKELYRSTELRPKGGVLKRAHNKAAETYSAVDDEAKMAAYLSFRERGLDSKEAATRTRRMLQNYDMVGHLFDQGAKVPVFGNAFVRFSSELMRIAHNTAVDNPIRAASAVVAASALITMASKASGESPEDRKTREERLGAPRVPFTHQSLEVQTPWGAVNAGRLLGITTYNDLTGGMQEDAKRLLPFQPPAVKDKDGKWHLNAQAAGSDPLIGPLVATAVNRDFRGKNIADPDAEKYPSQPLPSGEQNKNRLKYLGMSYVPLANEGNSVASAAKGTPNYYGKERSLPQAGLRVGGIKVEKYGTEQAQKQRETDSYFKDKADVDKIASQLPSKEAQDVFKKYTSSEKVRGNDNKDKLVKKGLYDTATKAQEMIKYPEVFEALKKKSQMDSKRMGLPTDPIYDLPKDRLTAFWNIQIANSVSPGSPESKKLKQDAKDWYFDLAQKRSDYFNQTSKYYEKKGISQPLQGIQYPEASADVQKGLDELNTISDGAERGQFYKDHPDIIDFYKVHDRYIRQLRFERGLPQFDQYPEAPPEVQGLIDTYSSLPKHDGPKGGSKTRSMWIQSHPNEWAMITGQFDKQAQYNLENDAARAIYSDEDFGEKGIKAIKSLAMSLGSSDGSSSGSSYSSSGYTPYVRKGRSRSSSSGSSGSEDSGGSGSSRGSSIKPSSYMTRIAVRAAPTAKKTSVKKVAVKPRSDVKKAKMGIKKAVV